MPLAGAGLDVVPGGEPFTPGEILRTEFLEPMCISQSRLARATGLPTRYISDIVRGRRAISVAAAMRLSRALGVDDLFWINVHIDYDLELVRTLRSEALAKVTPLVSL